jgi:uncharacterized protein with von Willebrand factor type A (vWA) domain
MAIEFGKIIEILGEKAVGEVGAPLGLNEEQSVKLARSLAANIGAGNDLAIKGAAAETGIPEDVVKAMLDKLYETGKEKILADTGIAQQAEQMKDQAIEAAKSAAGGFLGRLFGRKG